MLIELKQNNIGNKSKLIFFFINIHLIIKAAYFQIQISNVVIQFSSVLLYFDINIFLFYK